MKRESLERIWVVFSKEVQDNWRDRRSIVSSQLIALIGPLFVIILLVLIGRSVMNVQEDTSLLLPVEGAAYAPNLIEFLEQNNVKTYPSPPNPEKLVRGGDLEVVLIIPESYPDEFTSGRPAALQLIVDSTRQSSSTSVARIRTLLGSYSQQIGTLRLMARGIDPASLNPIEIQPINVATSQSQIFMFFNMLPYFVILVVFLGGMYVIIDATAGERERGSLEPLLINPVPRWELIIGKLAASLPFAALTLFLTLAAFGLIFNYFPMEEYIGVQLSLNLWSLVEIFFLAIPMIVLASALQMIIATFTHSFKEAQTYVGFLPLIPALPGIGLAFLPIRANIWNMLIPTFGQQLLINQILRAEPVNLTYLTVSTLATLLAAFLLILLAVRLYQREQVIFGGIK
jgi:sodium transport system permease protein